MDIAWENLGDGLKSLLVPVCSNSRLLPFAFEDLLSAKELLEDIAGVRCDQEELRTLALELCQWKKNYEGYFKRRRTSFIRPLLEEPALASQPAGRPLTVASVFDEICNRQLVLKSNKKKSTYSRSLLLKGADRAELEKQERSKWALVLAGWIVEANLPIVPAIEATQNPAKAWVQIFGARRPKSLRNRARTWGAVRAWLALACEVTFPTAVHHMLDYWDSRGEDLLGSGLGGTSMPGTILAALMPMEAMGQIDQSAMICRNSAFVGAVNNWTMLLTRNHTTVRKANLPTLSLVMALELLFTNAEASLFMLSWTWLML